MKTIRVITTDDKDGGISELQRVFSGRRIARIVAFGITVVLVSMLGAGFVGFQLGSTSSKPIPQPVISADTNVEVVEASIYRVSIVKIPEDDDRKAWTGVQVGDIVEVQVSVADIQNLLDNATTATVCTPDGLALSGILSQSTLDSTECGSFIHAVLVQPL